MRVKHYKTFGAYLKGERIPQSAVADPLRINQSTISRIANGHMSPSYALLLALMKLTGLPATAFQTRKETR